MIDYDFSYAGFKVRVHHVGRVVAQGNVHTYGGIYRKQLVEYKYCCRVWGQGLVYSGVAQDSRVDSENEGILWIDSYLSGSKPGLIGYD